MDKKNNKEDIEVVQGIGNLDISPVFDNATSAKPKMQDEKPKNIVIPQVKKQIENNKGTEEDDSIIGEDLLDNSEDSFEEESEQEKSVQKDTDSKVIDVDQIEFEDIDIDSDITEEDNNDSEE